MRLITWLDWNWLLEGHQKLKTSNVKSNSWYTLSFSSWTWYHCFLITKAKNLTCLNMFPFSHSQVHQHSALRNPHFCSPSVSANSLLESIPLTLSGFLSGFPLCSHVCRGYLPQHLDYGHLARAFLLYLSLTCTLQYNWMDGQTTWCLSPDISLWWIKDNHKFFTTPHLQEAETIYPPLEPEMATWLWLWEYGPSFWEIWGSPFSPSWKPLPCVRSLAYTTKPEAAWTSQPRPSSRLSTAAQLTSLPITWARRTTSWAQSHHRIMGSKKPML